MYWRLLTPWRAYDAWRDQLGSLRSVVLASDHVHRRGDLGAHDELVLLLHSPLHTRNLWDVMEDRLRHDGYGVMSFSLPREAPRSERVDHLAGFLAEKIERLVDAYGFKDFHIVAHSSGGLVACRYVEHYGGDRRVRSVITLGTRFHPLVRAVLDAGTRQLGLHLTPATALPRGIPLTSIASRDDLVVPRWASRLHASPEAPVTNLTVAGVGHTQLAWDASVYAHVRQRLDEATRTPRGTP